MTNNNALVGSLYSPPLKKITLNHGFISIGIHTKKIFRKKIKKKNDYYFHVSQRLVKIAKKSFVIKITCFRKSSLAFMH